MGTWLRAGAELTLAGARTLEKETEAVVAPVVAARNGDMAARNGDMDRRPAHQEAALGLVVQHRDEFGAIVGLAAQRLVRDDDRGSRHCGRCDAIEHILRDGDAVERVLGVVPVVDRDRSPTQARAQARATAVNTCVPIGLSGLRIVTGASVVASNTSPPSGDRLCVSRRT